MTRPGRLGSLILIGLLFVTGIAQAEDDRGRVMYIRGSVTALDDSSGVPRILRSDSRVRIGEIIETGPRSVVQIVFPDRSMLHVKSESRVKVEEYNFTKAKPAEDDMVVNVLKGGMRSLTGLVGKRNPDKVRYKTPVATIGIRGTIIEIRQDAAGNFQTLFDHGRGYMLSEGEARLLLDAGEAAQVSADGKLLEKIPYERSDDDPARLAARLAGESKQQVLATTNIICKQFSHEDATLTAVMGKEISGDAATDVTIQGLTSCLPIEVSATLLSTMAYLDPESAPAILDAAIEGGTNVAIALESVLRGMENAQPEQIQDLIEGAVTDHGLSTDDAGSIRDNLSKEGSCR